MFRVAAKYVYTLNGTEPLRDCYVEYAQDGTVLGIGKASDEDVIKALKLACAYDFVQELPNGIYSDVKEQGGGFSEGQLQRLSIARALLADAPILLLDEATSALDGETELAVLQNIMKENNNQICIIATHRPEVFHRCTRVFQIKNNTLKEVGKSDLAGIDFPN